MDYTYFNSVYIYSLYNCLDVHVAQMEEVMAHEDFPEE